MAGSGGRLRSGPAPDPSALRRERDSGGWTRLPGHGLTSIAIPEWPAEAESQPTVEELAMWQRLWRESPQAWVWQRHGQGDFVAIYVRAYLRTVESTSATMLTALRQWAEMLLLSIHSLGAARYSIDLSIEAPIDGLDAPAVAKSRPETRPGSGRRPRRFGGTNVVPIADEDDDDE